MEWLDTIPGVNRRLAEVLVAEVGTDTALADGQALGSQAGEATGIDEARARNALRRISPGDDPAQVEKLAYRVSLEAAPISA